MKSFNEFYVQIKEADGLGAVHHQNRQQQEEWYNSTVPLADNLIKQLRQFSKMMTIADEHPDDGTLNQKSIWSLQDAQALRSAVVALMGFHQKMSPSSYMK